MTEKLQLEMEPELHRLQFLLSPTKNWQKFPPIPYAFITWNGNRSLRKDLSLRKDQKSYFSSSEIIPTTTDLHFLTTDAKVPSHPKMDIRKKVVYSKGGEALEHVAQRGGGCPILRGTQGQALRTWWRTCRCPCSLQDSWTRWPFQLKQFRVSDSMKYYVMGTWKAFFFFLIIAWLSGPAMLTRIPIFGVSVGSRRALANQWSQPHGQSMRLPSLTAW